MNRRQRREMAKRLGISEHQKKLSRERRFELIRENIIAGKQSHREFVEQNRINLEAQIENIESSKVYDSAKSIAKEKNIPVIDALPEAQEKYGAEKK